MKTKRNLRAVPYPSRVGPSGPEARRNSTSFLGGGPRPANSAPPAEQYSIHIEQPLTEDELARCVTIWSWLRQGTIDAITARREIKNIENHLPPCDSCRIRGATMNLEGWRTCGSCYNGGRV